MDHTTKLTCTFTAFIKDILAGQIAIKTPQGFVTGQRAEGVMERVTQALLAREVDESCQS